MEDKRKHKRQRFERKVWIEIQPGTPLECYIRDVSQTGACLTGDSVLDAPVEFTLLFDEKGSTARWCRVSWRHGDKIGVEFKARLIARDATSPAVALSA